MLYGRSWRLIRCRWDKRGLRTVGRIGGCAEWLKTRQGMTARMVVEDECDSMESTMVLRMIGVVFAAMSLDCGRELCYNIPSSLNGGFAG